MALLEIDRKIHYQQIFIQLAYIGRKYLWDYLRRGTWCIQENVRKHSSLIHIELFIFWIILKPWQGEISRITKSTREHQVVRHKRRILAPFHLEYIILWLRIWTNEDHLKENGRSHTNTIPWKTREKEGAVPVLSDQKNHPKIGAPTKTILDSIWPQKSS